MFVSCTTTGPTDKVYLGVFDAATNVLMQDIEISKTAEKTISKTSFNACLSDPPAICYMVYTYVTTIDVENSQHGYVLTIQDALRIEDIINITNSANAGITITANIPGIINGVDYHVNTSPFYIFKDTSVVCHNAPFTYQFGAEDVDGDSLSYSFGSGYNVTNPGRNTSAAPPSGPPYPMLTYTNGYSGASPLGSGVTINASTGVISGVAPAATGAYVVAVYVQEWRKGILINNTKKELQINVASCSVTGADLKAEYINCDNFTINFQNESTSSNVSKYAWNFGEPSSPNNASSQPTPSHTYKDTGTYRVVLTVSSAGGCTDSAVSSVKVYPGIAAGFTTTGSCYKSAFPFFDASYAKYGAVNSWRWNFGDNTTTADTSLVNNPAWLYTAPGNVTVSLAVATTMGCTAKTSKTVTINGNPTVKLPFTDTLICLADTLQLAVVNAPGNSFSWSPAYNIVNSNTATPSVYPDNTTVYTVVMQDKGCTDSATVKVNVLPYVTLSLTPDTAMCKTDTIILRPVSDALQYVWTESGTGESTLSSNNEKYPLAVPLQTTNYTVEAILGHCHETAGIIVSVSPYPVVTVSSDVSICFGKSTRLQGTTNAPYFVWSPASSLQRADTLAPLATPQHTTTYRLTAMDTGYCKKPVTEDVVVTVIPPVRVNAGNDTFAVLNQPVQLLATANTAAASYVWTPALYLDNVGVNNPVATVTGASADSVKYLVTVTSAAGCVGTDEVIVRLFKTAPDIFIPTAFTPNGDGTNDLLIPVAAGIQKFNYFRVFSRWGQLLFETSQPGKGWDGSVNGVSQPAGTYIFIAQAVDYLGHSVLKRGTVVLIR